MHLYFEFEDLGADQGKTKHGMAVVYSELLGAVFGLVSMRVEESYSGRPSRHKGHHPKGEERT